MIKNRLKRGEECGTYLTQVCRHPSSIERSTVNTVAFMSYRSRLTIMLAGADQEGNGAGEVQVEIVGCFY